MKNVSYLLVFNLCLFVSCSVVDSELSMVDGESSIKFENSFPNSASDANNYLRALESKSWSMNEFTIEGINGFQSCRLDDKITLNSDNTYDYDGGSALCGSEDNVISRTGTWSIDFESRLFLVDEGAANEFTVKIESLTEGQVVFRASYYGLDVLGKFSIQ